MTARHGDVPPYLPPDDLRAGLVKIGTSWTAVSVPSDWGGLVRDLLGDYCGPVFEEPALSHLVWILPPGGASHWPDAKAAGVVRYGPGDSVLVPCSDGYDDGTRWLRSPLEPPLSTDPGLLRAAVEFILGPLAEAAVLGPMVVCQYCRTPTRDGRVTDWYIGPSGPLHEWHACPRCWRSTIAGGEGRHLRAVRRGPR